jgi:hypothetical protein
MKQNAAPSEALALIKKTGPSPVSVMDESPFPVIDAGAVCGLTFGSTQEKNLPEWLRGLVKLSLAWAGFGVVMKQTNMPHPQQKAAWNQNCFNQIFVNIFLPP